MPRTENAVEKSVKKNPATTTAPTLRTFGFVVEDEKKEEDCEIVQWFNQNERTRFIHSQLCQIDKCTDQTHLQRGTEALRKW